MVTIQLQEKLKQFEERLAEERHNRLEERKRQRKEERRITYYREKEEEEQRRAEEQMLKGNRPYRPRLRSDDARVLSGPIQSNRI